MTNKLAVDEVALLAQADLLILTVELLRAPENQTDQAADLLPGDATALVNASGLTPPESLASDLIDLVGAARDTDKTLWSGCWRLLFDASLYCPINESAYVRRDKGAIIGDVCGFYRAFGWQPAENGERPDHLLTELEFLAALLIMLARSPSDSEMGLTRNAAEKFARDHLGDWIPAFAKKLEQTTTLPVLQRLASWLGTLWDSLVRYHGWEIDSQPCLRSDPGREPENVYECGAPDLVQLQETTSND